MIVYVFLNKISFIVLDAVPDFEEPQQLVNVLLFAHGNTCLNFFGIIDNIIIPGSFKTIFPIYEVATIYCYCFGYWTYHISRLAKK